MQILSLFQAAEKLGAKAQPNDLWKCACRSGPSYCPNSAEHPPDVAQTSGEMDDIIMNMDIGT